MTRRCEKLPRCGSRCDRDRYERPYCTRRFRIEAFGTTPVDLIVIETNGEVEGVDTLKSTFDGATGLDLNVFTHDFDTVAGHAAVVRRQVGVESLSEQCRSCSLMSICGGGYLPHRYSNERGFDNPSVYCESWKRIFGHIWGRISPTLVLKYEAPAAAADPQDR